MCRPRVYVGTYHKYNCGSIYGAWIAPGDYEDLEAFLKACSELHRDEPPGMREFMFQDIEGVPGRLYDESYFSEELFAYCKAWDEASDPDALEAYAELFDIPDGSDSDDILDDFGELYHGYYDSDEDAFYEMAEEEMDITKVPDWVRGYFDYEGYARDMMINYYEECNGYYFRCRRA